MRAAQLFVSAKRMLRRGVVFDQILDPTACARFKNNAPLGVAKQYLFLKHLMSLKVARTPGQSTRRGVYAGTHARSRIVCVGRWVLNTAFTFIPNFG